VPTLNKRASAISWLLQVAVAAILFQTLVFKFSAAAESTHIFETLGLGTVGRIGSEIAELFAAALPLTLRTVVYGAALALGVICVAIVGHMTKLGVVVNNNGGLLFGMAVVVLTASATALFIRRAQTPMIGRLLARAPRGTTTTR